jgi:hypothetical protein
MGALENSILRLIVEHCRNQVTTQIVTLRRNPMIKLMTMELSRLIEHDSSINHEVIIIFLDILYTATNSSYVDPSFSTALQNDGWDKIKHRFAGQHSKKIDRPHLQDSIISMPLFEITAVESPYAAVEYKEKYTSFMQMT